MATDTTPPRPRKPSTHSGDLTKLAPALAKAVTHLPNFVLWKWVYKPVEKKWTKPPYEIRSPRKKASSTDPATWATYPEALATRDRADGIGVVLTGVADLTGVDFDHCRNPVTGATDAWVKAYLEEAAKIGAYVEVSVSG